MTSLEPLAPRPGPKAGQVFLVVVLASDSRFGFGEAEGSIEAMELAGCCRWIRGCAADSPDLPLAE
jgi:hypothetical protein